MVFVPKCYDRSSRKLFDGSGGCRADQRRILLMAGPVTQNSADRFRRAIGGQKFAEYWLDSGGGSVKVGLEIGKILRDRNAFVRVPGGRTCASICTFAFLGGRVRTVHPTAKFKVHAASSFSRGLPEPHARLLKQDPRKFLQILSEVLFDDSTFKDMFTYAQKMIGGRPQHGTLNAVLRGTPERSHRAYLNSDQFARDLAELRSLKKGDMSAANDVLMRFERRGVRASLEVVAQALKKENHRLGRRAKPAWRIIDTMYNCRITDVCELDQTTLREFGYTNLVD